MALLQAVHELQISPQVRGFALKKVDAIGANKGFDFSPGEGAEGGVGSGEAELVLDGLRGEEFRGRECPEVRGKIDVPVGCGEGGIWAVAGGAGGGAGGG
jgi:hypothetical protein